MKKRPAKIITAVIMAAFAVIAAGAASVFKPMQDLEAESYDIRVLAFAPETKASQDVVMIWLDEATMKDLPYRSPIPRDFLARLHKEIIKTKPWLVAYDIFFKDPSFPEADKAFATAIEDSVTYSVVPMRPDGSVDSPLPMFESVFAGTGLADLPFNPFDSIVREAKLSFDTKQGEVDSFAAAIFSAATGVEAADAIKEQANAPGFLGFRTTPFIDKTKILIRFAGRPGVIGGKDNAFKIYSASMVEKGLVPSSWLADKIVLVGASYEDLKDAYLTPYFARTTDFARMTGVEIHANVVSSLLTHQFYFVMTRLQKALWIFVAALTVALICVFVSPCRAALMYAAAVVIWLVAAVAVFRFRALSIPVVAPFVAQTAAFGAGLGWRALTEGRQRRFIKNVFARYVPASVVERMIENPELLKLGGETRVVTSLFTDIASFTSISEKLDPQELVALLNEYLGEMNAVLFKHGATLDKYEGDAIIAFFNAPLDVDGHEMRAAMAAIEMRGVDERISRAWKVRCGREIKTRIGLCTGTAVVGNMGSEGRFDYTAIGDTINLASRLEGANKFYGTNIMASESAALGLTGEILKRPVDRVKVKGKSEPITIYEVIGLKSETDPSYVEKLIEPYCRAFDLFNASEFQKAHAAIESILSVFKEDGPSCELAKRCNRAMNEPGWDLVTEFTTK